MLAVGDASFQQKCLDRMRSVIAQGTTLIFVSHDLAAVEATCQRGIWLNQGAVQADGTTADSLGACRRSIEETAEAAYHTGGLVNLLEVAVTGEGGTVPRSHGPLEVSIVLEVDSLRAGRLFFGLSEGPAPPTVLLGRDLHLGTGEIEARCSIARLPPPGALLRLDRGLRPGPRRWRPSLLASSRPLRRRWARPRCGTERDRTPGPGGGGRPVGDRSSLSAGRTLVFRVS